MRRENLISILALLLTGCEACNQCDRHVYGSLLFVPVYVARFSANDPVLAVRVGKMLGKDCLGEVEMDSKNAEVWIYAKGKDEAACIRKALSLEAEDGKLQFDDRGPPLPWENSRKSTTRNASNPTP